MIAGLGVFTILVALAIQFLVRDPARADSSSAGSGFSGFAELLRLRVLWPIIPLTALNASTTYREAPTCCTWTDTSSSSSIPALTL